ncbi:MAG TPA: gluconeogenesis factor YvcK family protein [Chloroflexota bacterium]|nr:gluconeogenesis factor YvcK family protein [Chloroflexota bacterium]
MIQWLRPGLQVKRWLLSLFLGVLLCGLGVALLLVQVYREVDFPGTSGVVVYLLFLEFIGPQWLRGLILILVSTVVVVGGLLLFNRTLLTPFAKGGRIIDIVLQRKQLQRGPKIVAIGGGHGLSTLLHGLKEQTSNLTAIVTVADDGGSSGRLRKAFHIPAPGDIRNCIAALADAEPLVQDLFQYRFGAGSDLEGHSFGNLFIAALSRITGNFERALRESSRVLAVRGQILPSTLEDVTLSAVMADELMVHGESNIPESGREIDRVYLQPDHILAYPEAVAAILDADMIVIGPGSLYTSILPNLLIEGIQQAVRASNAVKVYVCNVATQRGETDGFEVDDHIRALYRHGCRGLFDFVLANSEPNEELPSKFAVTSPPRRKRLQIDASLHLISADVVSRKDALKHDPDRLAERLMDIYYGRLRNPSRAKAS